MTTISNTGRATLVATVIGLCLVGPSRSAAEKHAPDVFARGHRTAPIPIALASGKVHLKMRIGDGEAVWFLLDTGANTAQHRSGSSATVSVAWSSTESHG